MPQGAKNNMIIFPGDEQEHCVNILRCGSQQCEETAFSSGLQACLGLVCSPQEPQQRLRAAPYPSGKRCLRCSRQRNISCSFSLNSPLNSNVFVCLFKGGEKKVRNFCNSRLIIETKSAGFRAHRSIYM